MKTEVMQIQIQKWISVYNHAKCTVIASGYDDELDWQESVKPELVTESSLLCDSAWVILCSGFREKTARKIFPGVSLSFFDWESAAVIAKNKEKCCEAARCYFNHKGKIEAIAQIAEIVYKAGFKKLYRAILDDPLVELQKFPFIGPITVYHLAKNLGFAVAKPDRHLVRIAGLAGYSDVQKFCSDISKETGDPVQIVDIVFWRYATLDNEYMATFESLNGSVTA